MQLEEVRRSFGKAAEKYDSRLRFWFGNVLRIESYRAKAIDSLGDLTGKRVLDIGCGTGANHPLLISRVGPEGIVVGLDYTPEMLNCAREQASENGWGNIEFIQGDAVLLDMLDEPFDAIVSTWCLGMLYDLDSAVSRATDLLSPGGRIAVLDFYRARVGGLVGGASYAVYSRLMKAFGVAGDEDLDDERIRGRWDSAKSIIRDRFELGGEYEEEFFLFGTAIRIAGRMPN